MEERIQIEDLRKKIIVENQYGQEIGIIYISPDDYNILERAKTAEANIQNCIKEAEKKTGQLEESDEKAVEIISEIDKRIKNELDNLFDYPVSEQIFGNVHCLSTKNGKYFVENFLNGIMPVINKTVEKEAAASKERMDKYLKDYMEGQDVREITETAGNKQRVLQHPERFSRRAKHSNRT